MIATRTRPTRLWKFNPGDWVYVRGWSQHQPAIVVARLENHSWPHYIVGDYDGNQYRISQLQLSSKPIIIRGEQ